MILALEFVGSIVVGVIAFLLFHFGCGWGVAVSIILAIVCALIGLVFICCVDGSDNGSDWGDYW